MSKTILLELTPREVEILQAALIKERFYWEDSDKLEVGATIAEKSMACCDKIWAKLDNVCQPKQDELITAKDLFNLISSAKGEYQNLNNDLHISNKKVEENYFKYISLANALISWLNSKHLLKRLARFDVTDVSNEFEESE